MKWGKPEVVEPPAPESEPVQQTKVEAKVAGGMTYTWTFEGEKRNPDAISLMQKLTGAPDEHGWIKSRADDWAVRPEEILGVRLFYTSRKAESPLSPKKAE